MSFILHLPALCCPGQGDLALTSRRIQSLEPWRYNSWSGVLAAVLVYAHINAAHGLQKSYRDLCQPNHPTGRQEWQGFLWLASWVKQHRLTCLPHPRKYHVVDWQLFYTSIQAANLQVQCLTCLSLNIFCMPLPGQQSMSMCMHSL